MRRFVRFAPAVGILAVVMTFTVPRVSKDQVPVDPDHAIGIFQEGVLRGEVMRVDGDDRSYVEHWVLYPDYVYPGARNRVKTELVPAVKQYRDLDDFFARVPFE